MRIVIITDSLGLPRKNLDNEINWPSLIIDSYKNQQHEIYFFPHRGRSSNNLNLGDIKVLNPDVIIFQIGIVDATRRALYRVELSVLKRIFIINKFVNYFTTKFHYQLTRIRNIHYAKPNKFKKNLSEFLTNFNLQQIYFIEIAKPGETMKKKVYKIESDIHHYNSLLQEIGPLIRPYNGEVKNYIRNDDGHHLTDDGHLQVYNGVKKILDKLLEIPN